MKKIIAILLAVMMLAAMLPMAVLADTETSSDLTILEDPTDYTDPEPVVLPTITNIEFARNANGSDPYETTGPYNDSLVDFALWVPVTDGPLKSNVGTLDGAAPIYFRIALSDENAVVKIAVRAANNASTVGDTLYQPADVSDWTILTAGYRVGATAATDVYIRVYADAAAAEEATQYTQYVVDMRRVDKLVELSAFGTIVAPNVDDPLTYVAEIPSNATVAFLDMKLGASSRVEFGDNAPIASTSSSPFSLSAELPFEWGEDGTATFPMTVSSTTTNRYPTTYTLILKKGTAATVGAMESVEIVGGDTFPAGTTFDSLDLTYRVGHGQGIVAEYTKTSPEIELDVSEFGGTEPGIGFITLTIGNVSKKILVKFYDPASPTTPLIVMTEEDYSPLPSVIDTVTVGGEDHSYVYYYEHGTTAANLTNVRATVITPPGTTFVSGSWLYDSIRAGGGSPTGQPVTGNTTPIAAPATNYDAIYRLRYVANVRVDGGSEPQPRAYTGDNVISMVEMKDMPSFALRSQPQNLNTVTGTQPESWSVVGISPSVQGSVAYQWQISTIGDSESLSFKDIPGATDVEYRAAAQDTVGVYQYRVIATNTLVSVSGETISSSVTSDIATVTVAPPTIDGLEGTGTAADPYILADAQDFDDLKVAMESNAFEGRIFHLTNDVTLPAAWATLGGTFSGTLDGNGNTITIPNGGKAIFSRAKYATVKNLNIFGENIVGAALVDDYYDALTEVKSTITIENVTLKSGSHASHAGFVHGIDASGQNNITISNSTIEAGVTIGSDSVDFVGSFVQVLNGTISNSTSAATIIGRDFVGGFVGAKGQAMGVCEVVNSSFTGSVTGVRFVGGIFGAGYRMAETDVSSPNTPGVSIRNSFVSGSVTGDNYVGGLYGGDRFNVQTWDNGVVRIQHNTFYGTLSASGAYVGGIIGYMDNLNKFHHIENNYYLSTQAARGIGYAHYVDTNKTGAATTNVGQTFNTATGAQTSIHRDISRANHNRTDDPMGADATKLAAPATAADFADGSVADMLNNGTGSIGNWITDGDGNPIFSNEPVVTTITLSGTYPTQFNLNSTFNTGTLAVTASLSDGSSLPVAMDDPNLTISGYDMAKRGVQTVTVGYKGASATYEIEVIINSANTGGKETFTVTFSLLGAPKHNSEEDGIFYTLADNNLTTWIAPTTFEIGLNDKVIDVIRAICDANNISYTLKSDGNYIADMTHSQLGITIGEFTNGPLSGWMYTLNGKHPDFGVAEQFLNDGDVIVLHYTDDFTKEEGSEKWNNNPGGIGGGAVTGASVVETVDAVPTIRNGEATATISTDALNRALDTVKRGLVSEAYGSQGEIILESDTRAANSLTMTVDATPLKAVAAEGNIQLTVRGALGSVTLDPDTLKGITDGLAASAVVEFTIARVNAEALTDEQKEIVGDNPVYALNITAGGTATHNFDGTVTVFMPFVGANAGSLAVYYVDADGKITDMQARYDASRRGFVFTTTHFSVFMIAPITLMDGPAILGAFIGGREFDDVNEDDWFFEAVKYVVERGLMNGVSDTEFAPRSSLTRAMLVTILYRNEGSPSVANASDFDDVAAGQWYSDAIAWATANEIVSGYGDGKFGTDDSITREQAAVILFNYAKHSRLNTAKTTEMDDFADAASVSSWAADAIGWAVAEGLLNGRTATELAPQGTMTRAEVATILRRYLEDVAS